MEYPFIADFYHKEEGRYYACFKSDGARHAIFERDGILFLSADPLLGGARLICHVEIYEDIGGEYFPCINDASTQPDAPCKACSAGGAAWFRGSRQQIVSEFFA